MATEPGQNNRVVRSIIYGSVAVPIKKPETDHTHKWTVYVKGAHDEDISTYVRRVVFRLHESFPNPSRTVEGVPFEVSETGWGEFQLGIRVVFHDPHQKPLSLVHHLKLYPTSEEAAAMQVRSSRPVVSEHYEEIIFDPPTAAMAEVLIKEPQYQDLSASPRYAEISKLETDELKRIEAAIAMVQSQLSDLGVVSANKTTTSSGSPSEALPSPSPKKHSRK